MIRAFLGKKLLYDQFIYLSIKTRVVSKYVRRYRFEIMPLEYEWVPTEGK